MKRVLLLSLAVALYAAGTANAADKNPIVVMDTSLGKIKIELYQDKAPITVKNFLGYVDDKFYDATIFHRVLGKENTAKMEDFMIQGGGFEPGLKQKKTKEAIKNESDNGLSNERGTLAMARTDQPDTATAQFYINVKDNKFLDRSDRSAGYCVFGRVIDGMDVVDKIKTVKTKTVKTEQGTHEAVPTEDVVIKSVRREEK